MAFWEPGKKPPSRLSQPAPSGVTEGTKQHLSKSVLSMKFMSRKRDAEISEHEEKSKRLKVVEDVWSVVNEKQSVGMEENISKCKFQKIDINSTVNQFPGRRSFGGFNPIVERIYDLAMGTKSSGAGVSVSDAEMAAHYESLVSLPRGPNQGRPVNKPKGNKNIRKEYKKNS